MKKILIIGTAYPYRGGLAAYNERLATEFKNNGEEVTIHTFKLQYPGFLFPGKSQFASWEAPKHLSIKRTVNSINPFNWIWLGWKIKRMKPDLVIFKYWIPFMAPCFGTIARIIKRNKKTRIITIVDNMIPHEKRPGDRLLNRYFVKPIDAYIAMSESVLGDIKNIDREKPRALSPHPLFDNFGDILSKEEALNKLGLPDQHKYILFFGFIRDYKGLDLLLKAMAEKEVKDLPVKVLIAGEFYTKPDPYYDLIKQLRIEDRVILKTKFIADSEVKNYFCASDLVVQPYKSATQSGVTQIAYHFNKPMIVTDVGGLAEIVPDGKTG
ncbi:D-inositol-3-phosphate glycosyltransferase [subsurface metagenome]